jgi:hypothetical protein
VKHSEERRAGATAKSAEQQLLESIDAMQAESENGLAIIFSKLNGHIAEITKRAEKPIIALQGKILKRLVKDQTESDNTLDKIGTIILQGLDAHQFESHMLLTQLATKCGCIKCGQPLEAALVREELEAPNLAYLGTLLLAVGDLKPLAERLVKVLEEIRDRMPSAPAHLKGEFGRPDAGEPTIDVDAPFPGEMVELAPLVE